MRFAQPSCPMCVASWVPLLFLSDGSCFWQSSAEVRCKWVSPLFPGSMLCWCRRVPISMTSLYLTNSPTSWLRQAPCLLNPQTRLCKTQADPSDEHFLDVLHQSRPVPLSHATALNPASSISSGELIGVGTGYATTLCTSRGSHSTPDLEANIHRWSPQNPPRSFKIVAHSSEVFWYWACDLSSCFPLIIIFKWFTKHLQNRLHQYWIARIQQRGFLKFLPSFLCTFFKVALQGYFDSPTVEKHWFHMYSLDSDRIFKHSEGTFTNFILVDSFHDEFLLGCSCSQ